MWYENVDKNIFLKKMYKSVPALENINLLEFNLQDLGGRGSVKFEMPKYADNPPPKWKTNNYNSLIVEICFSVPKSIKIESSSSYYKGNLDIFKTEGEDTCIRFIGTIDIEIITEGCFIGSIKGITTAL